MSGEPSPEHASTGTAGAETAGAETGRGRTSSGEKGGTGNGELSYEAARDELAGVVVKLESGGLGLEESLALWERGEELARICQRFLDGARERVETALARADDPDAD